jgi:hypothetical protein
LSRLWFHYRRPRAQLRELKVDPEHFSSMEAVDGATERASPRLWRERSIGGRGGVRVGYRGGTVEREDHDRR